MFITKLFLKSVTLCQSGSNIRTKLYEIHETQHSQPNHCHMFMPRNRRCLKYRKYLAINLNKKAISQEI